MAHDLSRAPVSATDLYTADECVAGGRHDEVGCEIWSTLGRRPGDDSGVAIPHDFTLEQRVVMITALEEGYLNEVIMGYGARLRWAETASTLNPCLWSAQEVAQRIPHFVAVVTDMIERDLISIREPENGVWDDAPSLTCSEVDVALSDPATWIWDVAVPENNRMIMVMTTDHGDRVVGRLPS